MNSRGLLVPLVLVCSCGGGEQQQVVTPPPLHINATPPPPQRARWQFQHPERGLLAKLDLGDGRTLYIGANGRRDLGKGTEPLTDATTLAMADLVGVVRDDKGRFVFLASDGATFVSQDPLGALDVTRPGPIGPDKPNARLSSPTTGKSALMGIYDGRVLRSADFGQTWAPVEYAGASKPYGHPGYVVLDGKGSGLLLHFPQRLYLTHDDGATWAPIPVGGHSGIRWLTRDGEYQIFAGGFAGARMKFDGTALAPTTETSKPAYTPPPSPDAPTSTPNERTDSRTVLTGDRVVEFTEITRHGKVREIEVGSATLGDKVEKPATQTDLVGASGLSKLIAGYGSELVYLRDDEDTEDNAPTTTVYRSKDYGATWQKESQLQGVEPVESESQASRIEAGPKGWVYVTSLCPKDETSNVSACARRQVRVAGGAGFEDLAFTEEFVPLRFAFDEPHNKAYALGLHEGKQYLYESALDQNKFSRTKLLEDVTSSVTTALAVDAKGAVRVFEWSYATGWRVHGRNENGKDQPAGYLNMDRGTMALAGARGVLFAYGKGWETNDGGETWVRVATNGYPRSLVCSTAGCINGDAQRIGWDLPALATPDKVMATADPPKHDTPTNTTNQPPPLTPTTITCKVAGTASSVSSTPSQDMVDGVGADRWATIKRDQDSKLSIVVGTTSSVRELPLLPALPKTPPKLAAGQVADEVREGEKTMTDGIVVARYRFQPKSVTGTYNPVDVELAWWSSVTGRVQHKTLAKVAPFRISRYGFSGTPQILRDGLLFQGAATDKVTYVHDDGKTEDFTLPAHATIREVERLKKQWILADSEGGLVQLSTSADGKAWQQTAWGLDNTWGNSTLSIVNDKMTVAYGSGDVPALLFQVDVPLLDDPPAPTVVDTTPVPPACDAKAGRHRFSSYLPSDRRPVRVVLEETRDKAPANTSSLPTYRVTHDTQTGHTCTSAYVGFGYGTKFGGYETTFVYPEANGKWSGWRFRRPEDRSKTGMLAEPLVCK